MHLAVEKFDLLKRHSIIGQREQASSITHVLDPEKNKVSLFRVCVYQEQFVGGAKNGPSGEAKRPTIERLGFK